MKDSNSKPSMQIKGLGARWRRVVQGPGVNAAIIAAAVILAIGLVAASSARTSSVFNQPAQAAQPQPPSLLTPEAIVEMHEDITFRARLRVMIIKLNEMMARAGELGSDIQGLDVLIDQMQQLYESLDLQKRVLP